MCWYQQLHYVAEEAYPLRGSVLEVSISVVGPVVSATLVQSPEEHSVEMW
jgi:hypothetical protein